MWWAKSQTPTQPLTHSSLSQDGEKMGGRQEDLGTEFQKPWDRQVLVNVHSFLSLVYKKKWGWKKMCQGPSDLTSRFGLAKCMRYSSVNYRYVQQHCVPRAGSSKHRLQLQEAALRMNPAQFGRFSHLCSADCSILSLKEMKYPLAYQTTLRTVLPDKQGSTPHPLCSDITDGFTK